MSGESSSVMSNPAVENLRDCQRQLDQDGCEVGVSRQAVCETLELLSELAAALAKIEGGCFDGASNFIIAGDWKGAYGELQKIARAAMTRPLTCEELATPSYKAALTIAHEESARNGKRAGMYLFASLLMLVDPADGGLRGLDEFELEQRAERYRIPADALSAAIWSAPMWPVGNSSEQSRAA